MNESVAWHEVPNRIPYFFTDNGCSNPLLVFRNAYYCVMGFKARRCSVSGTICRIHDWGYTYGRLKGSGTEHLTKNDWDIILRDGLADKGLNRTSYWYYKGVKWFGGRSWKKNGRMMERMGDVDFNSYLTRKFLEERGVKL